MRGGAIAPFIWSLLLLALCVINIIWTSANIIQACTFGAAILVIWAVGLAMMLLSPEARRRGPPSLRGGPEAIPSASAAAATAGIGFGAFVFGWAFGHFWVYLGAGVCVASLGRLAVELRAQRRQYRRFLGERALRDEGLPATGNPASENRASPGGGL